MYIMCKGWFGSGCVKGKNAITYDAICYANTPENLVIAYRARARYMRQVLIENGLKFIISE